MTKTYKAPKTIAIVGNYLPRRCGIATFTTDICEAIAGEVGGKGDVIALAMNDIPEGYRYPPRVRFEIRANVPGDYSMASDFLNINKVDVVIIQHEFGIFGGPGGAYLLRMLKRLRMPVIITLHTVIKEPALEQRNVMLEIIKFSELLVVMSKRSMEIMKEVYNVPEDKAAFIPHGIPDLPFVDPNFYKDKFGVEGRRVILTFGLLSPGKGIEFMIEAMPEIVKKHPDVVYTVLGATHPTIKRRSGEEYRLKLQRLVVNLKMQDYVIFLGRFVTIDELCEYLGVADLYVTPYLNKEHIVSGTLAYALGAGKAVVSTPYWYAEEMLADSKGYIVPFGDSNSLAKKINYLFSHELERHAIRKKAYQFCRDMVWKKVARSYLDFIERILADQAKSPSRKFVLTEHKLQKLELPEVDLRHLKTLTDDTGILQHAICTTPNRRHGYCTDDNARALIVTAMWWHLFEDDEILPLMQTYLSFLVSAFNDDTGYFRNFLSYERRWLEEVGSEDSHGRALWSLGVLVSSAPNNAILNLCVRLFNDAIPVVERFTFLRSRAFALVGIHAYLRRFGGDASVKRYREILAKQVFKSFISNSSDEWPWCEDVLTYANAKLPHALILSGQWLVNQGMLKKGLDVLKWLIEIQTNKKGHMSIIGNDGWFSVNGQRARFDQQPIEAMGLIEACLEAYNVTQDNYWLDRGRKCINWFLGSNDLNMPMYNFKTGGCHDGLTPSGINPNQGAESTLAWLISILAMHGAQEDIFHLTSRVHIPEKYNKLDKVDEKTETTVSK